MKKLVGLFIATLGVIAIASCNKEPDPSLEIGVDADVVVESPSATYTFTFTTNQSWTAESDSDWLTLEVTSGQAGDIALVASFTANNTSDYRYAKVSIKAGALAEEYTLAQKPVVKSAENVRLGKAAQDIEIPVNKDADAVVVALDSDWLTKNESASTNSKLVLSATANESTFAREVTCSVTNNGSIKTLTVRQSGSATDLAFVDAVYLGRKNLIYDSSSYSYLNYDEFALVFNSEDNKKVVLTVNAEPAESKNAVPSGKYVIDAAGTHEVGTFTIEPSVDYYTSIEGIDTIIDGEISVESENGVYSIVAIIYETEGKATTFSFEGKIENIKDESLGGQVYSISYNGQYDTYFTPTQAKKWYFDLFISRNYDASIPYIPYISLSIYGASSADSSVIPEGTYTIIDTGEVETIDSPYANGIKNFQPFTVSMAGNDETFTSFTPTVGGTVTITRQENGKYSFAFDTELTIEYGDYDDNWNWVVSETKTFDYKASINDVALPEVDLSTESKPILDGDAVLGAPASNYLQMYWYGQKLGDSVDAFWGGFQNLGGFGGYTAQFAFTVADANYTYEQYNTTTYSRTTYTPVGTYNYSSTVGDFKLVPTTNSYVQNPYTGTMFYITGGSIKLESDNVAYGKTGTITYDIKGTPGTIAKDETTGEYILTPSGPAASFTGSHNFVWYRVTDRSTNTSAIALFKVAE